MHDTLGIAILYLIGIAFLVADLFLPSHGLLTLVSLASLVYGLVLTFQANQTVGLVAMFALAVFVPTLLIYAVKVWHRTPVGRRISPPNPVLTEQDRLPLSDLQRLIGLTGRSVTLLRPVGTCVFDGRRVECMSEQDVIAANVPVEAVRLADRTLVVRALIAEAPATT